MDGGRAVRVPYGADKVGAPFFFFYNTVKTLRNNLFISAATISWTDKNNCCLQFYHFYIFIGFRRDSKVSDIHRWSQRLFQGILGLWVVFLLLIQHVTPFCRRRRIIKQDMFTLHASMPRLLAIGTVRITWVSCFLGPIRVNIRTDALWPVSVLVVCFQLTLLQLTKIILMFRFPRRFDLISSILYCFYIRCIVWTAL